MDYNRPSSSNGPDQYYLQSLQDLQNQQNLQNQENQQNQLNQPFRPFPPLPPPPPPPPQPFQPYQSYQSYQPPHPPYLPFNQLQQFQQYRSPPETPSPPCYPPQNHFFPPSSPALARPWSCPRSPNQPMKCPLCSVPLEGGDVTSHFEEEVKQLETLRSQFDDWQSKDNINDADELKKEMHDLPEDSFKRSKMHSDKIPPCTRWQTYQRVKQNRQTRISGMLRTKRYDQKVALEEPCPPRSSSSSSSSPSVLSFSSPASVAAPTTALCKPNRGIWTIVDNHMQTSGS